MVVMLIKCFLLDVGNSEGIGITVGGNDDWTTTFRFFDRGNMMERRIANRVCKQRLTETLSF